MRKILISTLLLLVVADVSAYVFTRAPNGSNVKWSSPNQTIAIDTDNRYGFSNAQILAYTASAALQWKKTASVTLVQIPDSIGSAGGRNDLYFSTSYHSNSSIATFQSGTLAVTEVSYRADNGRIVEADIVINDYNAIFSSDPSEDSYMGNVITHEMGHFWGMAHGEVPMSTMFYAATRGQHTLAHDDESGIYAIYGGAESKGTISGYVVGGTTSSPIGVFGAHVEAISEKDGTIAASAITEPDGSYTIAGLDKDVNYYLYVKRLMNRASLGLSGYYSTARSDFCTGSTTAYRGSFYHQGCDNSSLGFPTSIRVDSSSPAIVAGDMTIQCDLDSPLSLRQTNQVTVSSKHNALVGYTSGTQTINIDLTAITTGLAGKYLDVKVVSQAFYSTLNAGVQVYRSGSLVYTDTASTVSADVDGNPTLDRVIRVPLSTTPASNNFSITINASSSLLLGSFNESDLFPLKVTYQDTVPFYFLNYSVSSSGSSTLDAYPDLDGSSLDGNSACVEAPNTYRVSSALVTSASDSTQAQSAAGCGAITLNDSNHNGPSGPTMMMFTMLIGFMMTFLPRKSLLPIRKRG